MAPVRDCGHYSLGPLVRSGEDVVVGASLSGTMVLVWGGEDGLSTGEAPQLPPRFILEEDARLTLCLIVLPGAKEDIGLCVEMAGEGAQVRIAGAYVCSEDDRVSLRTDIHHRVPSCSSDQLFCGIAGGSSKVSFHGRIVVAPDAQKTEAYQTNRNILLSDAAEVATTPQLEIYADDVRCSHGATVGSLDGDEQFYMRSRGVPEAEAKVLQMLSFVSPVLALVEDNESRGILAGRVETAIRSLI